MSLDEAERSELSPCNHANTFELGDRRRDHRVSCRDRLHRIRPFNRPTLVIAASVAKLPELLGKPTDTCGMVGCRHAHISLVGPRSLS